MEEAGLDLDRFIYMSTLRHILVIGSAYVR